MTRHGFALGAALTAALIAVTLGSLQSVAWNGPEAPAIARAVATWLDPGLLLEAASNGLAQPSESYFGYGRLAVAAYALLVAAVVAMRHWFPRPLQGWLAALVTLAIGGDIIAYWLSERSGLLVRRIGFWYTELPALAAIVLLLTGVGAWGFRRGGPERWLACCLPVSLAATLCLGYLPHGVLLGLALTLLFVFGLSPRDANAIRISKRALGAIALAAACGALALASTYRPTLRPGQSLAARPLPITEITEISETMQGARLHVFNTGRNRMSWLLVGRERPWRPVPAFVIEQPESGLFVFDTGLSDAVAERGEAGMRVPERWFIESRGDTDMTLPAQMRRAGLDPDAVRHIAISHLHGDHIGQLEAFPNAQIIGGPDSAAFARDHGLQERWHEQTFETSFRFGPFDQAVDLVGDGSLVLIRGGGHAREGLMLALALDGGPLLLSGDAIVHSDWLRSNDVQRIAVNADRAAVVRNQVRSFLDTTPGASVAFGHDLREIDCNRDDIVCHGQERFRPEHDEVAGR